MTGSAPLAPSMAEPIAMRARRASSATRVLHVINGEHYSGAERVQDLLAARLQDYGFEVGLICVKPGKFPAKMKTKTAPVLYAPMRTRVDITAAWSVWQAVTHGHYDLLHAHTPRSLLVASLVSSMARVPLVYHVHSPAANDSSRRWTNWFNGQSERICLRAASQVITVSHSLADQMQRVGIPPDRVTVVPNGVPDSRIEPRPVPPVGSAWALGSVALFRPRKGTEILIQALALLRDRGVGISLRAVGPFESADYQQHVMSLVRDYRLERQITWTGFTDDVDVEWRRMDLFILPSLFGEGMPMVVLEAMAAGIPVIASAVDGVPEVIRDRQEGLLVPAGDAQGLAAAIETFVSGGVDANALRRAARQRHAERFSDQAMASAVADVYRRVLTHQRQ